VLPCQCHCASVASFLCRVPSDSTVCISDCQTDHWNTPSELVGSVHHQFMSSLWGKVPHVFVENAPEVRHHNLNKIMLCLYLATAAVFVGLYATDANHLQCPLVPYTTQCITQSAFGRDAASDNIFCDSLVTASCKVVKQYPAPDLVLGISAGGINCLTACLCYSGSAQVSCSPSTDTQYLPFQFAGAASSVNGPVACATYSSQLRTNRVCINGQCGSPAANAACNVASAGFSTGSAFTGCHTMIQPRTVDLQCCGTVQNVAVCPGASTAVGVLSGYLSLWFALFQIIHRVVVVILDGLSHQDLDGPSSSSSKATIDSEVRKDTINGTVGTTAQRIDNPLTGLQVESSAIPTSQ
jgi:hypothetical protein